ncbi:MAG: hypothetical protein RIM84_15530 [Alphaproteobacteria bacterium]
MAKLYDDRSDATGPTQMWVMDWMSDKLFDGRRLWVLTVVDTWSRFCPVMRVRHSATAKWWSMPSRRPEKSRSFADRVQ